MQDQCWGEKFPPQVDYDMDLSTEVPEKINSRNLEEYVSKRIKESLLRVQSSSLKGFEDTAMLSDVSEQHLKRILQDAISSELELISSAPASVPRQVTRKGPIYTLSFTHKCLAIGCTNTSCDLCESNPRRGCTSDFGKKYFKGDILKAKCGGSIHVELINKETKERPTENEVASDSVLELCIVDGNKFDHVFSQGRFTSELNAELQSCMLLQAGDRSLLRSEEKALNHENGMVIMPIQSAQAVLCDLTVHCSSEALLSVRKPPFRLFARLTSASCPEMASLVAPAMSTNFIVASGRSRLSQKKSIPFLDDPVSRLENMGKERIKKLGNLHLASKTMNVDLPRLSCWEVATVADFQRLAFEVDTDGQVKQKLLHMLKMSEKAWEESRDHAATAITNDTRMRAWYRPNMTETQGLAYVCYLGEMEMERPVALFLGSSIILKECLDPRQRTLMKELQDMAIKSWWEPNHPNWTFFDFDSEVYKKDHRSLSAFGLWEVGKNLMDQDLTPRTSAMHQQPMADGHRRDDRSGTDHQISSCHSSASYRQRKKQKKENSGNVYESIQQQPQGAGRVDNGHIFGMEEMRGNNTNGVGVTNQPQHPLQRVAVCAGTAPNSMPKPSRFVPHEFGMKEVENSTPVGQHGSGPRVAPVVPRPALEPAYGSGYVPPEFKPQSRRRNEELDRESLPRPIGVEEGAVVRQFLVMPNSSNNNNNDTFEASSSGTGDNYNPPPQPPALAAELLKNLLNSRGMQNDGHREVRDDHRQGVDGNDQRHEIMAYLESLCSAGGNGLQISPSDLFRQLARSQHQGQSNAYHCSIESLSSHCKAVISEEEHIRQMASNVSNHELQHSFEAGMLDQMKQRASGSPNTALADNEAPLPPHLQTQNDLTVHGFVQDRGTLQLYPGSIPNGYILMPLGGRNSCGNGQDKNISDERKDLN